MRPAALPILTLLAIVALTPLAAEAQPATSLDRCVSALAGDVLRFVDKAGKCVRRCEDAKRRGVLSRDTKCRLPSNHGPTQSCLLAASEQIEGSKSIALKRCRDDEVALFYGGTDTCAGKNESVAKLLKCLAKRGEKDVEKLARKIYAPQRPPVCGDGAISGGESCDPGAFPDGCFPGFSQCHPRGCYCVESYCGNGLLDPGEDCDYSAYPDGCSFNQFCTFGCTCGGSTSAAFLDRSRDLIE